MTKRITRVEIRKRINKAWGPGLKNITPVLGYFEGHKDEVTESFLHELCHGIFLKLPLKYGRLSFDTVEQAIDLMPYKFLKDINEIKTIAAELILIKRMRLDLCSSSVIAMGMNNMSCFGWNYNRLSKAVEIAMRSASVQMAAKKAQEFMRISNKELYGRCY